MVCGWLTLRVQNSGYGGTGCQRVDHKLYLDYQLLRGLVPLTLRVVQGLMIFE